MKVCEKFGELPITTNNPVDNTKTLIQKLYSAGFSPITFWNIQIIDEDSPILEVLYNENFDPLTPTIFKSVRGGNQLEFGPFIIDAPYLLSPEIVEILKLKLVIHTIACCVDLQQEYIDNGEIPLDNIVLSALSGNFQISLNSLEDFFNTFVKSLETIHNTKCLRERISIIASYFFTLKDIAEKFLPSLMSITTSYLINILPPPLPNIEIDIKNLPKNAKFTGIAHFLKKETTKNNSRLANVETLLIGFMKDTLGLCKKRGKNEFFF